MLLLLLWIPIGAVAFFSCSRFTWYSHSLFSLFAAPQCDSIADLELDLQGAWLRYIVLDLD
jgi:hypothetical protein